MKVSAAPLLAEQRDEFCPLPPDYSGIPFDDVKADPAFNEAAVREVIIAPLLAALCYRYEQIKHDHRIQHPYLRVGSQNRPVELVPDYSLYVENRFAWVLDAKAPWEDVSDVGHIAQVYSYASHPEVRAKYFGLCNGVDFVVFDTASDNTPELEFSFKEIRHRWPEIWRKLNVSRFQSEASGARAPLETVNDSQAERPPTFDEICLDIMPLLKNGVTPENQTILSVLESVARPVGNGRWRLKGNDSQGDLFGQ